MEKSHTTSKLLPPVHGRKKTAGWRGILRYGPLPLSLAVLVALALPLLQRDFWYDESLTGLMAQWPVFDSINWSLLPGGQHPPLYPLIVKMFTKPFGYTPLAIRSVSLVAALVSLVGIYRLTQRLFDRKTAGWVALTVATSPFVLQYATEARSYSVAGVFIVFATLALVRAVQQNRWTDYAAWGILISLAAMTHYTTLLVLPAHALVYLIGIAEPTAPATRPQHRWDSLRLRLPKLWITAIFALATFSIWLFPFLSQLGHRNNLWIPRANIAEAGRIIWIFLFGSIPGRLGTPPPIEFRNAFLNEIVPYLLPTLLAAIATWLVVHTRERRNAAMQIIALTFIPLAAAYLCSLADIRLFLSRFLYSAALFLLILLGTWIAQLRWRTRLVVIALFGILLAARQPVHLPTGFSMFTQTPPPRTSSLCLLNPFDYSVAKYYFPQHRIALYNAADPAYDLTGWETIGPHRTIINVTQLFKDPNLLIVVNNDIRPPDDSLPWTEMETVGTFDNLTVYRVRAATPQP